MTELHTDRDSIPAAAQGCVLVVGNLDGVHLGHRALIGKAGALAKEMRAPLGVLTFEPHPRQFFQPGGEPFRLTLLPMKRRLLAELGVDHLFAFAFDREFSLLSGGDFIRQILVGALKARHIVVGADFAFGSNRSGTTDTLKAAAAEGKFGLSVVPLAAPPGGEAYSSSAIRSLLRRGNFAEAEALLGWPWQIEAPVIHGDARGRTLGYPTANQDVGDYVRIPFGVYAVKALIEGEDVWRNGAANFGIRPMFKSAAPLFETFIFDFAQEIYGKTLRVRPVSFLRAEMSFPSLEGLMAQMKEDCIKAMAVLKSPQS